MDIVELPYNGRDGYYMGVLDLHILDILLPLVHKKRGEGRVYLEYKPKKLKGHLKGADRVNARYCLVVGENELKSGTVWVKDLELKIEKVISMEDF